MSNNKLFIPKKLKIGFQNRKDCFSGKLAFIIYYDDKNKLRQETSFNNWIDKVIPTIEVDNISISNLYVNKNVGGDGYGWYHRNTYVRIFDSNRDLEFEISVENLIFILKGNNCIDGELQGEYIFAWDKDKLVLLPINSDDYISSVKYTSLKSEKDISSKNLIAGAVYSDYGSNEWLYCGKLETYSWNRSKLNLSPVLKDIFVMIHKGLPYNRINRSYPIDANTSYFRSYDFKLSKSGIRDVARLGFHNFESELEFIFKSTLFIKPEIKLDSFIINSYVLNNYRNEYIYIKISDFEYMGYKINDYSANYGYIKVLLTNDVLSYTKMEEKDILKIRRADLINETGYDITILIDNKKYKYPYLYNSFGYIDEI